MYPPETATSGNSFFINFILPFCSLHKALSEFVLSRDLLGFMSNLLAQSFHFLKATFSLCYQMRIDYVSIRLAFYHHVKYFY
jgi:hypothetical protein